MNHHSFRTFIKDLPNDVIKSWGVKPAYFKAVCMVLSMYGDYETGTNIRPSWLTVAAESGVNRKTAMKVRDILLTHDIIIQKGTTEANIAIYDFGSDVHLEDVQLSTLDDQLSITDDQLSSIDGHNTTYNTTINTKDIVIKEESMDDSSSDRKYISPQEMYKVTEYLWS